MTESLPLSVYGVHTSTREKSLAYKSLPVDLILIFSAFELLSHLKDLYEFSHRKSSSLPCETRLSLVDQRNSSIICIWLYLHEQIIIRSHQLTGINAIFDPIKWIYASREKLLWVRSQHCLRLLIVWILGHTFLYSCVSFMHRNHAHLIRETLNNIWNLTSILKNIINMLLVSVGRKVKYEGNVTKHRQLLLENLRIKSIGIVFRILRCLRLCNIGGSLSLFFLIFWVSDLVLLMLVFEFHFTIQSTLKPLARFLLVTGSWLRLFLFLLNVIFLRYIARFTTIMNFSRASWRPLDW